MTIYWIFFLSNVVLNFIKNKRIYYFVVLPLFILIFGLRYKVGADWGAYENAFYYPESYRDFEIGYLFLNDFSSFVFSDFNALVLIIFLFVTITHFIFWEKMTDNSNYAILLWLGLGFLSFGIFRQSIAATIFLIALLFLKKGKKAKAYLLAIVAILFHEAAIIFIPTLYFINKNYSKKIIVSIFIGVFVINFFDINSIFINLLSDIFPQIAHYKNAGGSYGSELGLGVRFLEVASIFIGATIVYDYCSAKNKFFPVIYKLAAIYLYCYLLFNPIGTLASRTSKLFEFSYVLLIIYMINLIKNKNLRVIIFMIVMFYVGLRYYLGITGAASLQDNSQSFIPYQNILLK